jgi:hypothetical protein
MHIRKSGVPRSATCWIAKNWLFLRDFRKGMTWFDRNLDSGFWDKNHLSGGYFIFNHVSSVHELLGLGPHETDDKFKICGH